LTKAFCFSGDTLVATKDGEQAIETIEAGDEVWAADPITGERKLSRVVARTMSMATALLVLNIGGEEVQATETHPFQVVGQGMTAAGNLKVGDKIERKDGESAEVESIALRVGSFPVFNLEVADAHTYFVGQHGLLVHNGCGLRGKFLGANPRKSSKSGREVIERMKKEGKIRDDIVSGQKEFKASDGNWYPLKEADMAHKTDAVTWWNETGRTHGAKSPEVRNWMLDSDNYVLDHYSLNRAAGPKIGENYLDPLK